MNDVMNRLDELIEKHGQLFVIDGKVLTPEQYVERMESAFAFPETDNKNVDDGK